MLLPVFSQQLIHYKQYYLICENILDHIDTGWATTTAPTLPTDKNTTTQADIQTKFPSEPPNKPRRGGGRSLGVGRNRGQVRGRGQTVQTVFTFLGGEVDIAHARCAHCQVIMSILEK